MKFRSMDILMNLIGFFYISILNGLGILKYS